MASKKATRPDAEKPLPAPGAPGGRDAACSAESPAPAAVTPSYRRVPGWRLDIPLGARLQLAPTAANRTFSTEYVGCCGREFLLARFPGQPGARQVLVPGAEVTVRYLRQRREICGFCTRVAGITVEPLPLLALGLPESAGALNLRGQDRANCFLPARVCGGDAESKALIANLSGDGCRLALEQGRRAAREGVVRGSRLVCCFRLFDAPDELSAPGLVCYVQEASGRTWLGMRFSPLRPADREQIEEYLRQVFSAGA
ncbi:MAG: PilZ domain-containing protein [Thermodesulfobacteriota bacterium]